MKKADLIKSAKECGCLLLNKENKLEIYAPTGKVFGGSVCHFHSYFTEGWLRSQLYEEMAQDMKHGVIDCPDHHSVNPKCDVCAEDQERGTYFPENVEEYDIWYQPDTQIK